MWAGTRRQCRDVGTLALGPVVHCASAMKPLIIDVTAKNDDTLAIAQLIERARLREGRARRPKGPMWAVSARGIEAA